MQDNVPRLGSAFSGALRVGALIDGNGGQPVRDAILRIDNGRIDAVGPAADFGAAAGDAIELGAERRVRGFADNYHGER